jgi:hypothetical protein
MASTSSSRCPSAEDSTCDARISPRLRELLPHPLGPFLLHLLLLLLLHLHRHLVAFFHSSVLFSAFYSVRPDAKPIADACVNLVTDLDLWLVSTKCFSFFFSPLFSFLLAVHFFPFIIIIIILFLFNLVTAVSPQFCQAQ